MDWLKEAIKRPLTRNFTTGMWDKFPVWEGVVFHVAESESSSLFGWFNSAAARASSHLYVLRDGSFEQYVSLKDRSWAQQAGNDRLISVETQGMAAGEWTDAQLETMAWLAKTFAAEYGFPVRLMESSKVTEKGIGYHLLGVPAKTGDKVSRTGGELWSRGVKSCPGPDRVKQMPTVVKKAGGKVTKPSTGGSTVAKWTGKMASPVKGYVSCEWRGYRNHSGIDIACPVGTKVYAAYAGKVEKAGWGVVAGRSGYGIVIRNGDREAQYYGHLSKIQVRVGQKVKQGQQIALSGATGNVTGPHLHFETWVKGGTGRYGQDTNPRVHFNSHHVKVGGTTGQGTKASSSGSKKKSTGKHKAGLYNRVADGKWGYYTSEALQKFLANRKYYTRVVDGDWGEYSVKALQRFLKAQKLYTRKVDDKMGYYTVKALQKFLQKKGPYKGYVADGSLGARTIKALQQYLGSITK